MMSLRFVNTEIIITPPGPDNPVMGYSEECWLVAVKTWLYGAQYGRVYSVTERVRGPRDPLAALCRELLFAEVRESLLVDPHDEICSAWIKRARRWRFAPLKRAMAA